MLILFFCKAITYHEFIEKTLITANYLINNNYQNKAIILLSENSINLMIYDLAISFFVGKSAIICREWNIEDIIDGINEIDADLIVYSNRYEELVNDIKKNISINTLLMEIPKNTFKDELFNLEIKDYEDIAKIVFHQEQQVKVKV